VPLRNDNLQQLIEEKLQILNPEAIALADESAQHAGHEGARLGGGHYQLTIVSKRFSGQPKLARHRMVYSALGELMSGKIHALALRTLAPEEL
jgi:BolA protein